MGKAVSPEVEGLRDSFWATQLPQTVGSLGAFIAAGGVGRALTQGAIERVGGAVAEDATKELVTGGLTEATAKKAAQEYAERVPNGALFARTAPPRGCTARYCVASGKLTTRMGTDSTTSDIFSFLADPFFFFEKRVEMDQYEEPFQLG
jgi:hypothetical protein